MISAHATAAADANAISGVTRDLRGRVFARLKARAEKLPVSEAHEQLFRKM